MSDEVWQSVRAVIGNPTFTLGPYFAYQAMHTPRHLLFTLARYKFAARLLPHDAPVRVLEMGCGEGFGTLMLTENGHSVLGVDFDDEAIQHAKASAGLARPNLTFERRNLLEGRFGTFDAVVSLDVIEHIKTADEGAFLGTVVKNLDPHGFCVIGTPNATASAYASEASKVGHVNLFSAERLSATLRPYFHNVFMFGMNDEVVHTGFYPMCHYLFALGCGLREP